MNNEIIQLCEALGFVQIESKNPYMISFTKEETKDPRINIYFTRMTVSVQYKDGRATHYKEVTINQLENILSII